MGEIHEVTELITTGPAQALAGLLGVPGPGGELPLLWHWVYLLDRPPQDALCPDGHQHRGGMPVPPGPGLRRMFAGGQVVISEEQDLVYREPGANGPGRSGQSVAVTGRDRTVAVDPVLLFRG
jgi:hydroxyacyl-ACP dehydratase HTD2-like protein with hotdog domain